MIVVVLYLFKESKSIPVYIAFYNNTNSNKTLSDEFLKKVENISYCKIMLKLYTCKFLLEENGVMYIYFQYRAVLMDDQFTHDLLTSLSFQ